MATAVRDPYAIRRRLALELERLRIIAIEAPPTHPDFAWAFMRYYLPHYMRSAEGAIIPPARWHREFCHEVFGTIGTQHAGSYLAPRGYAKSTIVSLVLPLAMMCRRLKHYIWLIEDTGGQAKQAMQAITGEMDSNQRLKRDFPHLRPTLDHRSRPIADRDDDMVLGHDHDSSLRIQALGAGQKLRGRRHRQDRPDLILIDDLENDESVQTKYQRDKMDMWLSSAVMGARGPVTDTYLVGTMLHFDAVLARLMKREGWHHHRYEAMDDPSDFSTTTWPEFWPADRLDSARSAMGPRAFSREVLHQAVNEDEQMFRPDWFKWREPPIDPMHTTIRVAVDPATGEKNSADYSSIVSVARTENRGLVEYDVLDVWRGRVRGEELQAMVRRKYEHWREGGYRPVIIFESTQAQVWAAEALQARGIPVRPIKPNKDKVLRAEAPSVLYETGLVWHSKDLRHNFFELELEQFPASDYDDCVDALVYGLGDLSSARIMRLRAV